MRDKIIGEKNGKLTVIAYHSVGTHRSKKYLCVCDCGNQFIGVLSEMRRGHTNNCGCVRRRPRVGSENPRWKGYMEIPGYLWSSIKESAYGNSKRRRKIEFDITIEYVWNLFVQQNRKCSLSGVELVFATRGRDTSGTASLDRINSGIGYVRGNVQWVHKDINIMKNRFSQEYFISMCKLVSDSNTPQ